MDHTALNPATTLLREQHALVRKLIQQISIAAASERAEPFAHLAKVLTAHEEAEEAVVYPVVRSVHPNAALEVIRREDEESTAKVALGQLQALDPASDEFTAMFDQFKLAVDAHAQAEEAKIFPLLEAGFAADQLDEMGAALRRRLVA